MKSHQPHDIPSRMTILSFILVSAFAMTAKVEVTWLDEGINFGAFNEDTGIVRATLRGVNTGDEPYRIFRVATSCGCTTAGYSREDVMPGDTVIVKVEFNPAGRPGSFRKRVAVTSNESGAPKSFPVTGVVIGSQSTVSKRYPVEFGDMKLSRGVAMIGEVMKGHLKSIYLETYNRGKDSLTAEIVGAPKYISTVFEPSPLPPGQQGVLLLNFRGGSCPYYGLVEDTLTVRVNGEDFQIPVSAMVKEDFSTLSDKQKAASGQCEVKSKLIELGKAGKGQDTLEGYITITNTGRGKLSIRRIYTLEPGVKIGAWPKEIKKGKTVRVPVAVTNEALSRPTVDARVSVITSDPFSPVVTVRVTAEGTD